MKKNEVVAVAGGAGVIGRALCEELLDRGFIVVAASRSMTKFKNDPILKRCIRVDCDLRKQAGIGRFLNAIDAVGAPLRGVAVCVAGDPPDDPGQARETMHDMLDASILCTESLAKRMSGSGGEVVLCSSSAGRLPFNTEFARFYAAEKGGLEAYVRGAALYFAPWIRINAIAPGIVKSPIFAANGVHALMPTDDIPLQRHAEASEAAQLIAWLLCSNRYMTGQTLALDGGLTCGIRKLSGPEQSGNGGKGPQVLAAEEVAEINLKPAGISNFRLTLWKPSHFPTRLEIHSKMVGWRTFVIDELPCGIRAEEVGGEWRFRVFSLPDRWTQKHTRLLNQRLRRAYGIDEDLSDFYDRYGRDRYIATALADLKGMKSSCPEDEFELLIIAVLLQNTTMKRSRDMLDRILAIAGGELEFDGVRLAVFCSPAGLLRVGAERLRTEAKVGYRDKTLMAIAAFFGEQAGVSWKNAGELIDSLCLIKGIGPYTAGVVSSSIFREPGAFGMDVWNSRILAGILGIDANVDHAALASMLKKRYAPYEGIAVEHLIEMTCLKNPVTTLYESETAARMASRHWPRDPSR